MSLQHVTPELKAKALACETPEEMLALAREEGYELTDEQLDSIAGGEELGRVSGLRLRLMPCLQIQGVVEG